MGWQDAPVVDDAGEKSSWRNAPLADSPKSLSEAKEYLFKSIEPGVEVTQEQEPSFAREALESAGKIGKAAIEGAEAIPAFGVAGGFLSKIPQLAKIPGVAKALEGLAPKSLSELGQFLKYGSLAGAGGEASRQLAEKSGAGSIGQTGAEILGGAAIPVAGISSAKKIPVTGMEESLSKKFGDISSAVGEYIHPSKVAQRAREEAISGIKSESEMASRTAQRIAQRAEQKEFSAQNRMNKIQDRLNKPQSIVDAGTIGSEARNAAIQAEEEAIKARRDAYEPVLQEAEKEASILESQGKEVDVSNVLSPLKQYLNEVKGIKGLEGPIRDLVSAVEGSNTRTAFRFDPQTKELRQVEEKVGRTFKELSTAQKFLADVGFGKEMEGYTAGMRNKARDASKALDKALGEFSNKYKQAKDVWREMSIPLEFTDTATGRYLLGREGGIKGEAYAKLSPEELPGKIFSSVEDINVLVDALAGGRNASPIAKSNAEKTVQQMALKWFERDIQSASQKTDVIKRMPSVERAISSKLKATRETEERVKGLSETIKEQQNIAKEQRKIQENLNISVGQADREMSAGRFDNAFNQYSSILRKANSDGLISDEAHQVALNIIGRAESLEERAKTIRAFVKASTLVTGGWGAYHLMQGSGFVK